MPLLAPNDDKRQAPPLGPLGVGTSTSTSTSPSTNKINHTFGLLSSMRMSGANGVTMHMNGNGNGNVPMTSAFDFQNHHQHHQQQLATAGFMSGALPSLVTPTSSAAAAPAPAAAPARAPPRDMRGRLIPPHILQRQASEHSAWVSEVDSHYHSDMEEEDEEEELEYAQGGYEPLPLPQDILGLHQYPYPNGLEDEELTQVSSVAASSSHWSRKSLALSEVDSQVFSRTSIEHLVQDESDDAAETEDPKEEAPSSNNQATQRPPKVLVYMPAGRLVSGNRTSPSNSNSNTNTNTNTNTDGTSPTHMVLMGSRSSGSEGEAIATPRASNHHHAATLQQQPQHQHPTHAFIPRMEHNTSSGDQQAGGDDTSEGTGGRPQYRYHVRSKATDAQTKADTTATATPPLLLQVWQQRATQAEERASTLTHRLALEERLHRQVAESLREAHWETSNLQSQLDSQHVQISELERQQRITHEWNSSRSRSRSDTNADGVATTTTTTTTTASLNSLSTSKEEDPQQRMQLAHVAAQQEHAKKQTKELIRDLKRSQDRLLKVEQQKMSLLQELASVQATQQVAAAVAATTSQAPSPDDSAVLRQQLDQVQAQVLELRATKLAVETRLQDALGHERVVQESLTHVQREWSDLQSVHTDLQTSHDQLEKRVRFADEAVLDYHARQTELEIRYASLQASSEQAGMEYQTTVQQMKVSSKTLESEKQDLYESLQQALAQHVSTQSELTVLQETSHTTTDKLAHVEEELEVAQHAQEALQTSLQAQLDEQTVLRTSERQQASEEHATLQLELNAKQHQVRDLQQALETSEGSLKSLQLERQVLQEDQLSLREQWTTRQSAYESLELERASFQQALEVLQDQTDMDQASSTKLQEQLEHAQMSAVAGQADAMTERRALEEQLSDSQSRSTALEAQVKTLENNKLQSVQECKTLVDQVAALEQSLASQTVALQEKLDNTVASMLQEYSKLEGNVDTLQGEKGALQEQVAASEARVSALEREVEEAIAAKEPLETQVLAASERTASLCQTIDETQTQVQALQENQEALQEEHEALQNAYDQATVETESLQVSNNDASNVVEALEKKRTSLCSQVGSLTQEAEELEAQVADSQGQLEQAQSRHAQAQGALQDNLTTANFQLKELKTTVESLEGEHESFRSEHDEAVATMQSKHVEEIERLRSSVASNLQRLQKEHNMVTLEMESAKEGQRDAEHQLEEARKKLYVINVLLLTTETEKAALSEHLKTSEARISKLENALRASKAEVEWSVTERDTLQSVKATLETKLTETEATLRVVQSERDELRQELEASKAENTTLVEQLNVTQASCKHLKVQLQQLNEQNDALRSESTVLRSVGNHQSSGFELNTLQSEKSHLETKLQIAQRSIKDLESDFAKAETSAIATLSELNKQEKNQVALVGQVKSLQSELFVLTSSRDAVTTEKEALVTEFEKSSKEMSHKLSDVESELDVFSFEIRTTRSLIQTLTAQKAEIEEQLLQRQDTLASVDEQLTSSRAHAEEARIQANNALLHHQETSDQFHSLRSQMDVLQLEFENVVAEKKQLSSEKQDMSRGLDNAKREFRELQQENEKTMSHQLDLEKKNDHLKSRLAALEGHADALQEEVDTLKAEAQSIAGEKSDLLRCTDNETEALRAQLSSLEGKKATFEGQLSASKTSILGLEARVALFEREVQDSLLRQHALESVLNKLKQEKSLLQERVYGFDSEATAVQNEVRAAKQALEEAEEKLQHSEEEKKVLREERAVAISRQAELQTDVAMHAAKLAALEHISSNLQGKLETKEIVTGSDHQTRSLDFASALGSLAPSQKEHDLSKAMASANATIGQLQQENQTLSSRLQTAEAALYILTKKMNETSQTNDDTLKKLGLQISKDAHVMKTLARQAKSSKRENYGLRRVARHLLKRIRELEANQGLSETSIDLGFSLSSTPEPKSRQISTNELKGASKQMFPPNSFDAIDESGQLESMAPLARVYQKDIILEMHYHDRNGDLQTYDVESKFSGPLHDGAPHGPGTLRFENGDMYLGEFENGEMNGVGAFAHIQQHQHANQVFRGRFVHNEYKGEGGSLEPPIHLVNLDCDPLARIAASFDSLNESAISSGTTSIDH